METFIISIQNVRCRGCEKTIKRELLKIKGISNVKISQEINEIEIQGTKEGYLKSIERLNQLGYPLQDFENNVALMAKSLMSCAKGKFK